MKEISRPIKAAETVSARPLIGLETILSAPKSVKHYEGRQ